MRQQIWKWMLATMVTCAACAPKPSPEDARHLERMAEVHAHDDARANAATRAPATDVVTREVVYATVNGQPVSGYLARPANAAGKPLPGIIVIHEWWGLNDNIRMMTRRLAGEGYTALAVDLYGGKSASTPQEAQALAGSVMAATRPAMENLRQAAEFLEQEEHAPKLATIGWCFGGGWSLGAGVALPELVDAVVMYYGRPITDPAELRSLNGPLLGLFGGADRGIPVSDVEAMERALKELGKDVTVHTYPGAAHAFANPSGTAYDPAAAEDAWQRTTEFLSRTIGGGR